MSINVVIMFNANKTVLFSGSDLHMSGFSDSNSDSFDESKRT